MSRRRTFGAGALSLVLAVLLAGCAADSSPFDAGARGMDTSLPLDAAGNVGIPLEDGGQEPVFDAGDDAAAQEPDSAVSERPVVQVGGTCGVLDTELMDAAPHWVQNVSTFSEGWTLDEASRLSTGAQTILLEGTAGGSSGYSEAFAFEVLHGCEGAELLRTETMIRYAVSMPSSITDMLVQIDSVRIGVSVTRAVTVTGACTRSETYTVAQATDLLTRKLNGIRESSTLVAPEDAWTKQILFVYADTEFHATALRTAWHALDAATRSDTILYVSVSEAMDDFIYFEERCR